MKLRLLDDSIRLRLSRNEVSAASEQGLVEGQTRFPDGSVFRYALETDATSTASEAHFAGNRLAVRLPARDVAAWAGDDTAVSLRGELALSGGVTLMLLVEKDFRCLSPREGEDQTELFQNPDSSA